MWQSKQESSLILTWETGCLFTVRLELLRLRGRSQQERLSVLGLDPSINKLSLDSLFWTIVLGRAEVPEGGQTDQWWGQIGQRNTQKEAAAGCMVASCCNTAGGVQVGLQIIRISPKPHKWKGLRVKLERCCPTVTCCGLHLCCLNVSLQRLSCSILVNRKLTRGSFSFTPGSLFVSSLYSF